jgi:hypothetical protein
MASNPLLIGVLAVIIVWVIRKLKWTVDGVAALWLTMAVSLILAVADTLLFGGPIKIPTVHWSGDPTTVLVDMTSVLAAVAASWGTVFGSAQAVYQLLRRAIGSNPLRL